ncbi:hypothetical protein AX16_006278, partial [Volvariella volvacea WC 439]
IIHLKQLRRPDSDVRKTSYRFSRKIRPIIAWCECLAMETGCWLLLNAQHTNSNTASIHYASPRLCSDALTQTQELSTKFGQLTSSLITSRRLDTVALAEQVKELEAAKDEAMQQAAATHDELEWQRAEAAAMHEMLTKLGHSLPLSDSLTHGTLEGDASEDESDTGSQGESE